MSQESLSPVAETAVAFGTRLASSQAFKDLFREGMSLVEETAAYLDGPGRNDSRSLDRGPALAYATESMRLTTRLEDEQPESIVWESSVAKVFNSESAWQVADDAVQLHGGSGFIEETGVARLLRDCRITRIFEGANELLRFHLASAAYTWKPEPLLESPGLEPLLDASLRECGRIFDPLLSKLAGTLRAKKKAHGLKIFQRQMDQHRIANAASGLFVMLSLIARIQGEQAASRLTEDQMLWTRHAVSELNNQVARNLEDLVDNVDDLTNQIAASECNRIGCPLKETVS